MTPPVIAPHLPLRPAHRPHPPGPHVAKQAIDPAHEVGPVARGVGAEGPGAVLLVRAGHQFGAQGGGASAGAGGRGEAAFGFGAEGVVVPEGDAGAGGDGVFPPFEGEVVVVGADEEEGGGGAVGGGVGGEGGGEVCEGLGGGRSVGGAVGEVGGGGRGRGEGGGYVP